MFFKNIELNNANIYIYTKNLLIVNTNSKSTNSNLLLVDFWFYLQPFIMLVNHVCIGNGSSTLKLYNSVAI